MLFISSRPVLPCLTWPGVTSSLTKLDLILELKTIKQSPQMVSLATVSELAPHRQQLQNRTEISTWNCRAERFVSFQWLNSKQWCRYWATSYYFIIIFLFTANLSRLPVWWVGNVGSVIKFLVNYIISLIRL